MTPEVLIDPVSHRLLVDGEPLTHRAFLALEAVDKDRIEPWARLEYPEIDPLNASLLVVGVRADQLVRAAVEIPPLGTHITVVWDDDWESPHIWASWDEIDNDYDHADPKDFVELGSIGEPGFAGAQAVWVKRTEWEAATEASRRALRQRVNHLLRSDRQELDEYGPWAQLPLIVLEDGR